MSRTSRTLRLLSFITIIAASRFIDSSINSGIIIITRIEVKKETVLTLKSKIETKSFDLNIEIKAVTRK